MRCAALTITLAATFVSAALAQQPMTQADLLRRVIDLNRLMTPPNGERTGMFSSYDRRSQIDALGNYVAWDANEDCGQFVREEADGWHVMAEMDGPGAITRIWSANPHGRIRFMLDGEPVIEADFVDLFNGKLEPFEDPLCYATRGGGHNCYFPIGYRRSCQVLIRESTSCYQIEYVAFPPGTAVQRFTRQLDDEASQALHEASTALLIGLSDKQLFGEVRPYPVAIRGEVRAGEPLRTETLGGGGIIRALNVSITDRTLPKTPYALHQCVLRIYFDGQQQPAVEVPLIDFFGAGFAMCRYNSLLCGTDKASTIPGQHANESRFMYCYFPMPFSDMARLEIESPQRKKIGLLLMALVERAQPPADALRFHARFRKQDPCQVFDYPILETVGPGRIVGCTLNVDCPRRAWWGEGDHKVWIDGEAFPSYFGTGTEGYLGDAGSLHIHAKPFHGATRTNPYGKSSGYRWHINDCINFERSARFTVENWQDGRAKDTYYGSVAYWYGQPDAAHSFEPLVFEQLRPPGLRIPGAVEVEGHIVGEGWGSLMKEKHARGIELSGKLAAVVTTSEPIQVNIPSASERAALLKLRVHPRRPFAMIELRDAAGRMVGTVQYDRESGGIYTVGEVRLAAGDNAFTVRCTKKVFLDCWILEDLPSTTTSPTTAP